MEKKWAPTNTAVGAYFWTIAQPFSIFRKLLAIIPSIQNHPHLRILNLKISTNTKSPMLLTFLSFFLRISTYLKSTVILPPISNVQLFHFKTNPSIKWAVSVFSSIVDRINRIKNKARFFKKGYNDMKVILKHYWKLIMTFVTTIETFTHYISKSSKLKKVLLLR